MKTRWTVLTTLALCLASLVPAVASAGEVYAKIGDTEITEEDLREVVGAQMISLDQRRHQLLEQALEQVVSNKLIELEAAKRGTTTDALAAELIGEGADPTDEEIDAFYEERKDKIRQPKEQVAEQIRQYLTQQKSQTARDAFVKELRGQYKVETFLEPYRLEVAATGPGVGSEGAPVTIVEFSDFECPFCSRVVPTLNDVKKNYGDKVRIVFRQFPLPNHSNAMKAAEASLCADEQGKFWELHDAMFEDQKALGVDSLKAKAVELGLEGEAFNQCLDSSKYAEQVQTDLAEGAAAGVTGTPSMFINGRFINGAVPYEQLATLIDEELESSMSTQ